MLKLMDYFSPADRQERIFSFEGGSSGSHYVEASFWRRLWVCRQTDY